MSPEVIVGVIDRVRARVPRCVVAVEFDICEATVRKFTAHCHRPVVDRNIARAKVLTQLDAGIAPWLIASNLGVKRGFVEAISRAVRFEQAARRTLAQRGAPEDATTRTGLTKVARWEAEQRWEVRAQAEKERRAFPPPPGSLLAALMALRPAADRKGRSDGRSAAAVSAYLDEVRSRRQSKRPPSPLPRK